MISLWTVGYNIKTLSEQKGLSLEDLTSSCNLSERDINRVLEGRLVLTPTQMQTIAKILGIEVDSLYKTSPDFLSFGECFPTKRFSNPESEYKILSIIDDYIDLVETVAQTHSNMQIWRNRQTQQTQNLPT